MRFDNYQTQGFYDELYDAQGVPRPGAKVLIDRIHSLSSGELQRRQQAAELALLNMGITFTVYGEESGTERIFPFDIVPRIIEAYEWAELERGLEQRIRALNLFLNDIYHDQQIVKEKVIPESLILSSRAYRKQCIGLKPPRDIWIHVTGTDLIRGKDGEYYVLEDNLRCPSGISYVLENRQVMKRTFPGVFEDSHVVPVDDYPNRLFDALEHLAPAGVAQPVIAVLTPGIYNSAYFEHSFLAQQMGVELVMGSDLVVDNDFLMMKTTHGLQRVDVLYRRIDDDFLDPDVFRDDSLIGIPGIFEAYRKGHVALANAPGSGIADDKVIYAFVPDMIRFYLDEEPILNNVPTYVCEKEDDRKYVLEHLDELVVKAANEAGGYGMLMGPQSTLEQQQQFAELIKENPRNYIAQPTIALSTVPTIIDGQFAPRHVDLRPYIVCGQDIFVLPGGLTRVALKQGSLVVNSSQGGGSKDTWVLQGAKGREEPC